MNDILSRYPQVAGDPLAMAMLCKVLSNKGLAEDAYALGLAAAEAAPGDAEVQDLVRNGLSRGVHSWHLPMLHDQARNRCYAKAIERMVKPGMTVLEIGSGAGLLAMLCARAGARMYTCEANPTVAAAAAEIVRRNGFADRVTVISKPSDDLVIGEDLPEHADLLVSELFDDSLFGDGILEHIADAKDRLLTPAAPVIPPRAELRCALVEGEPVRRYRPLTTVEGFDLSAFNPLAPPSPHQQLVGPRTRRRSQPVPALPVDFDAADGPGETVGRISMRSLGGRITGVAQWLRIDFGGGVIYENDPFTATPSHWGSQIHDFAEAIDTQAGDMIEVSARLVGRQLVIGRAL